MKKRLAEIYFERCTIVNEGEELACWGWSPPCRLLPRSWWDTMHRASPSCWLSSLPGTSEPGKLQQLREEMRMCPTIDLEDFGGGGQRREAAQCLCCWERLEGMQMPVRGSGRRCQAWARWQRAGEVGKGVGITCCCDAAGELGPLPVLPCPCLHTKSCYLLCHPKSPRFKPRSTLCKAWDLFLLLSGRRGDIEASTPHI